MRAMAPGGGFILGPGCLLPADTPETSLHIVMECAHTAGVYNSDGSLPWLNA
jgi:hypothetical protein